MRLQFKAKNTVLRYAGYSVLKYPQCSEMRKTQKFFCESDRNQDCNPAFSSINRDVPFVYNKILFNK